MSTRYVQDGANVVKEVLSETPVNFDALVADFISLRDRYTALPELKTVADDETLMFWNADVMARKTGELAVIQSEAVVLYDKLKIIYDLGFLPSQYEAQYLQLETFVQNI